MCDFSSVRHSRGRRHTASRSSKPRDVRQGRAGSAGEGGAPPHALRNRGMCDTRLGRSAAHPGEPPHALRNRGMCDVTTQNWGVRAVDPPHALRNRGMCDRSPTSTPSWLMTASRSSKPRDVRPRHHRSDAARRLHRLTLFETAGCATRSSGACERRPRSASRSSKPRDVRRAECRQRSAPRSKPASRSSKPRDVRRSRIPLPHDLPRLRLTLFETAGCATGR